MQGEFCKLGPCFLVVVVGGVELAIVLNLHVIVRAHGLDSLDEVYRHLCSKAHDQVVLVSDNATLGSRGQLSVWGCERWLVAHLPLY